MKLSKKWIGALSLAFIFTVFSAFAITNNFGVDNSTKIESVAKADCDKCGNADCKAKCSSQCKGKKGNKAKASAKKGCTKACSGNCCKGSSAKKSCNGKSATRADASAKKTTENETPEK